VNFAIAGRTGGTPPPPGKRSNKIQTQITLLRQVASAHGRHDVLVGVKSSASSAEVQLRLVSLVGHSSRVGAHQKTKTSSKTVSVRTNRQVKVSVSVMKIARARLIG
jgi:hypothetical protein